MTEPITVLVYHPNKILLQRLTQFIQAAGYRTISSSDEADAVRLILENKPEVFLAAPLTDGDLTAAAHVQKTYPLTRVIVLADTDRTADHAHSIGVDEVVVYDETDIGNVLESIRRSFPDPAIESTLESAEVLVVDDEPDSVDMLTEFLCRSGFRALDARTGKDALDVLKHEPGVRVVLLDIKLPDMGGVEVLTEIMNHPHPPAVIILTALRDSVIAQHALRLGAFDYLTKPIDLRALADTIEVCLFRMEYRERFWWNRHLA